MGLGREPKFPLWEAYGFHSSGSGPVWDRIVLCADAFTGAMTTESPGSNTWPPTLGVKLCRRLMEGIYDEEAVAGSGVFLHISFMFGGGTEEEC